MSEKKKEYQPPSITPMCGPSPEVLIYGFPLYVGPLIAICGVAVAGSVFYFAGDLAYRQIDTNYPRFFEELLGKDTASILFNIETMIQRYEEKNSIFVNRIKFYFTLLDVFKNLNRISTVLDGHQVCILYEITEYLREPFYHNKQKIIDKMILYAKKENLLHERINGISIITILIIILDIDFKTISDSRIEIEFKNGKKYTYYLGGFKKIFSVNKIAKSEEITKSILDEFRYIIIKKMLSSFKDFNKNNRGIADCEEFKDCKKVGYKKEFIDELINLLKDCYTGPTINYTIRQYLEDNATKDELFNRVKEYHEKNESFESDKKFTEIFVIGLLLSLPMDKDKFEIDDKEYEHLPYCQFLKSCRNE